MSKLIKTGYELCDINIVQSECSRISHRNECDTFIEMCGRKVHPVIVAPMAAVTNEHNYNVWLDNDFICVVPRSVDFETRISISTTTFVSVSLEEARKLMTGYYHEMKYKTFYICIDIAQGTMIDLYAVCHTLKDYFKNIVIMAGNVATPEAYRYYAVNGIDYMRLSVGSGTRCTTAANVGIHYPVASLVDEIVSEKKQWDFEHPDDKGTEIIVDGGISNFDDIQKCLALGAFAVMNGSSFAKSEEACGEVKYFMEGTELKDMFSKHKGFDKEYAQALEKCGTKCYPYREYYGMSTRRAQKETKNSCCTRTSEGISLPVKVEYPIAKWADNMKSYLQSAMSYTGSHNIYEFRTQTELIINLSGDKSFRK